MSSSLSSEDITVTKSPTGIRTTLFKRNSSLSTVGDKYSFTRARNTLASLITSIQSLEPPSYWYNISDINICNLCELVRLAYCVFLFIIKTCGLIRQKKTNGMMSISIARDQWIIFISQYQLSNVEIIMSKTGTIIDDKLIMKNLTFIGIGNRSSSSYLKAITQYNHYIFPPIIKLRQLRHVFINSISVDI